MEKRGETEGEERRGKVQIGEGRRGRTRKETAFEFKLKFGSGGWSSFRNGKC